MASALASLVLLFAWTSTAHPGDDVKAPAAPRAPELRFDADAHRVGEWFPDIEVTDLQRGSISLSRVASGKPLVVVAREASCPLCKKYRPALARLESEWMDRVAFVFLNVSAVDDLAAAKKDAELFQGVYCRDPQRVAARSLGITSTTEVLVFDEKRTLCYRGAVDDQYGIGYAKSEPTRRFAVDALRAVVAGGSPAIVATTAPGCVIDLGDRATERHGPTYHNRVSRIVQAKCQNCHREGGVGPFALETYKQVAGRRGMIEAVVEDGLMPPWYAEKGGPWENDWSLTDREKRDLLAWIEAKAPEGDAANAPRSVTLNPKWMIGDPDLVLEIPEAYSIPAEGVLDYRYTYVQSPLTEDRWIESMEIRPTAPGVVHHVLVFLEEPRKPNEGRREFRRRFRGGLRGYFAGMVPGQGWTVYPNDMAKKLPAGAWLKFQIHYTPNGVATEDRTRIAFRFRDKPPKHEMRTASAAATRFRIPAGDDNYKVEASYRFRTAATLYSFAPHMHVRGKAFRYELVQPDGERRLLLDVPRYDFNWQLRYRLRDPIPVPVGATIHATAWYDNSDKNPANPNPNVSVRFGEQTFDEMMIGYFELHR